MNVPNTLARACGTVASVAGAATLAGRSRREGARGPDPALAQLSADFSTTMRIQIETARRYELRFTLTATDLADHEPLHAAQRCAGHIRLLDAVTVVGQSLVVLWWNTDRLGASAAIRRLVASGVLDPTSPDRTGGATYPSDGLTEVALLEHATAEGQRGDLPSPWSADRRPTGVKTATLPRPRPITSPSREGQLRAVGQR